MRKPKSTVSLTPTQREAGEQARLKRISLKWAKIAREKAKEDVFTPNGYHGFPPAHPITVCIDIDPSDVELALATNGTSLRRATLTALLAAMVLEDVPTLHASRTI